MKNLLKNHIFDHNLVFVVKNQLIIFK